MRNHIVAKVAKSVYKTCAKASIFCGLLVHKVGTVQRITWHLSIGLTLNHIRAVRNTRVQAPKFATVVHTQSPTKLVHLTDTIPYLYTLYTPPITTTTNIFI